MGEHWDPRRLPDLTDRTVVVTGGSGGIGYFAALQLAGAGARVVLACRDAARAERAIGAIRRQHPDAVLSLVTLDTSSLASVAAAADQLSRERVDALVCNAAVVFPPHEFTLSVDGNELTLAINFLGHAALIGRLLPTFEGPATRIVLTGSLATHVDAGRVLRDLELSRYRPGLAYSRSKLAVEAFGLELARRLAAAGSRVGVVIAHPGTATDALAPPMPNGSTQAGHEDPFVRRFPVVKRAMPALLQGKDAGAWPLVRGAVDSTLPSGAYLGPRWRTKGQPVVARPSGTAADPRLGALFWGWAERLTGVPLTTPTRQAAG